MTRWRSGQPTPNSSVRSVRSRAQHAALVRGVSRRLLGEQEAGARYRGCGAHVEQAAHVLGIGDAPGREHGHLTSDIQHLGQRTLDRLDPEQMPPGL